MGGSILQVTGRAALKTGADVNQPKVNNDHEQGVDFSSPAPKKSELFPPAVLQTIESSRSGERSQLHRALGRGNHLELVGESKSQFRIPRHTLSLHYCRPIYV